MRPVDDIESRDHSLAVLKAERAVPAFSCQLAQIT